MKRGGAGDKLLSAIARGDEEAFAAIYRMYHPLIYRFVLRYVHAKSFAEDITQEVFMKIWQNREQLTELRSFKSFLFSVARNHTINSLKLAFRSKARMREVLTPFLLERNNTEEELLQKEYRQFLKNMLEKLPQRTREIFMLCRDEGKSYQEAATLLGISKNAIKNHMVFSMKVFRSALARYLTLFF